MGGPQPARTTQEVIQFKNDKRYARTLYYQGRAAAFYKKDAKKYNNTKN